MFSGPAEITIKEGPNPYSSLTTSNLYTITGLSSGGDGDLTVSVPLARGGTARAALRRNGDGAFRVLEQADAPDAQIGVVAPAIHYPEGAIRVLGFLLDAKAKVSAAGEAAVTSLSNAISSVESAVGDQLGIYSLVYDKSMKTYYNNFEIFMTQLQWDESRFYDTAKDIGWFLEGLRSQYTADFGMQWSAITPATRILFEDLGGDRGLMLGSKLAQYADVIVVDKTVMPSGLNTELKATLAHEFFHLLQGQYDPRWLGLRRTVGDQFSQTNAYLWWHEATATAMEARYSGSSDTPDVAWDNWSAPYDGMVLDSGPQTALQRHGYGMSGLAKYLMDSYGTTIMGTIYQRMRDHWLFNNGEYPFESIAKAANGINPDNISWWRTYLRKNTTGEIYPEIPPLLAAEVSGKPESNVTVLPSAPYYPWPPSKLSQAKDLSATPFFVDLNAVGLTTDQALTFAVPFPKPSEWWFRGDMGLMVFKVSHDKKKIEYLDGDGEQAIVSVPNPVKLASDGWNLLVLLLNNRHKAPYTDKSNYMLYAMSGRPASYTHSCAHANVSFAFSGFRNVIPYLLADNNNMNLRAEYPNVGGAVSATVTVDPLSCENGKEYYWCFNFFGKSEGACRAATCGTPSSLSFDSTFTGKTKLTELEGMGFSYAVRGKDTFQTTLDCSVHISPFLLDMPAS